MGAVCLMLVIYTGKYVIANRGLYCITILHAVFRMTFPVQRSILLQCSEAPCDFGLGPVSYRYI